jgi:hypothetical protein
MRVLALAWVLGRHCDLTILYAGAATQEDVQLLQALRVPASFHAVATPTREAHQQAVRALCARHHFDACVIERLTLDHVRDALPPGVRSVLDSHDLLTNRTQSRAALGLPTDATTLEWELARYARYDCVLMIQADEHALVAPRLRNRVILAPHPVSFERQPVRAQARVLGFVGAHNEPNLHGLDWFADTVWPLLDPADAEVHVFGRIAETWRPGHFPAFVRHGFVADLRRVWGSVDVAINPVRWGSGLKIKSVEALGHGLPLVATSEGARGLGGTPGATYLVADDPAAFAAACNALLADAARRDALGHAGFAHAQAAWSPRACFGEFVDWLTG